MINKNILELCLAHGLGGLEMFVASCYEEFSVKNVCKVVVSKGSKLDNYLAIDEKFYIKRSKFFPIFSAIKLARYIDEQSIDIVHFHWNKDIITAVLAKLLSKRQPKLVQSRHMRMTRFKNDIFHRFLYKHIDTIHAVTHEVREQLEEFITADIRPQIEMVYLGVSLPQINKEKILELQEKYKIKKDDFVIGITGRIEEAKGQYQLIEVLFTLKHLNIKLFIVGAAMNSAYLQDLQKRVVQLGLEDRVIFTGFTREINAHMQLFDINVLATKNETFGLVVLEAMANKVALITTNSGGPLEILKDGVSALFYDASEEDLAKKIKKLYKDVSLRERIVKEAYKVVQEKFDKKRELQRLYKAIL